MPFENIGTLQKSHMTKTPPEIDKCETPPKMTPYKNSPPCEKISKVYPICYRTELDDS